MCESADVTAPNTLSAKRIWFKFGCKAEIHKREKKGVRYHRHPVFVDENKFCVVWEIDEVKSRLGYKSLLTSAVTQP